MIRSCVKYPVPHGDVAAREDPLFAKAAQQPYNCEYEDQEQRL